MTLEIRALQEVVLEAGRRCLVRRRASMVGRTLGSDPALADLVWVNANIRQGHGPLGAAYPRSGFDPSTPGVVEGDTPSFLHLVSAVRGVNDPDRPDQGGWGGQFVRPDSSRNHWFDDPAGPKTVYRWRRQVQEELADRTDRMLP